MSHDADSASHIRHHGNWHHCSRSDINHSNHQGKDLEATRNVHHHSEKRSRSRSLERKKHKHAKYNKDRSKDSRKKTKKEKRKKKEKKRRKKEESRDSPEATDKPASSKSAGDNNAYVRSLSTMAEVPVEQLQAEKPVESEQAKSPASNSNHPQVTVGGFGTFGPPPKPSASDAGDRRLNESSGRVEQARSSRGDNKDRRRRRSRSRSPSKSRSRRCRQRLNRSGGGDGTRRRSRSRSRSSDLNSEVSVRLSGGSGSRLQIDKQRLRRKALENTVMRMTERCPKKLAEMSCFKTLGVRVSELESICRRLAAQDQTAPSPADTAATTASGEVAKDAKAAEQQPGQRQRQEGPPSAGVVRHPFQLRPSSEAKSSGSRFGQSSSMTTMVAASRKELLAAFPVSRGDFHSQVTVSESPTLNGLVSASSALPGGPAAHAEALLASYTNDSEGHSSWDVGSLQQSSHSASSPVPAAVVPPLGDWASVVQMQASGRSLGAVQRANSPQAWVTKQQFLKAQPITGGIGHQLLEKMGWKSGQGLGKRNEGPVEPLAIDFKSDRKGLASLEDNLRNQQLSKKAKKAIAEALARRAMSNSATPAAPVGQPPLAQVKLCGPEQQQQLHRLLQPVNGKHPICFLMEFARQRKWPDPQFRLVQETGPQHERCFLICVKVCGTEYQPPWPSRSKKDAKTAAASLALQHLGLIPAV